MREDPDSCSPHSNVEREKTDESSYFLAPKELVELVERSLDEPPTKRRYAWFQDILQDAERHGAPLGSFRE